MRYRLRTLLMVTAIAGLLFARMAYLKQQASAHRRVVESAVAILVPLERGSPDEIRATIGFLALADSPLTTKEVEASNDPRIPKAKITILENAEGGFVVQNVASVADWRRAIEHQILAERFDRAFMRPWTLVSQKIP